MKFYDVSLTISNDLPTWPGDPSVSLQRVSDMDKGDGANVSRLDCGVHTGTHVDAPVHFVPGGSGVDTLSLDTLIGMCEVRRVPDEAKAISAEILEALQIPFGTIRVLFRTSNSAIWARGENKFQTNFVAIDQSGAEWIVAHGIKLVGVDYLSVAPFDAGLPTHDILLRAGVIPIEGLNLSQIEPGEYLLYCLPLKLKDADGAPARVVLIH
ncbi:MAG TPA: cyclase family protein [Anaerolineae bacterium]|nr:cyclase family protein [Anaerolineae bacterium]